MMDSNADLGWGRIIKVTALVKPKDSDKVVNMQTFGIRQFDRLWTQHFKYGKLWVLDDEQVSLHYELNSINHEEKMDINEKSSESGLFTLSYYYELDDQGRRCISYMHFGNGIQGIRETKECTGPCYCNKGHHSRLMPENKYI